ncbi:MAG: hypothetical protein ACKOVB_08535 [Terrabacter sp.]
MNRHVAAQLADPLLVLLPSPLLGPSVWAPVAERLSGAGWSAAVCRQPRAITSAEHALAGFLEAVPTDRPVVLVPHSNAGLFVPAVAAQRDVVAAVFVDAALPSRVPSGTTDGETTLGPASFLGFLEGLADADGLLPPWTRWWDVADVDALFPDAGTRRRVEQEQRRLPLAYFRDTVAVPSGWTDSPNAYLAFGDTYADERRQAEQWGWPVTTMDGDHLHLLVSPAEVAAALVALLGRLGVPAPADAP